MSAAGNRGHGWGFEQPVRQAAFWDKVSSALGKLPRSIRGADSFPVSVFISESPQARLHARGHSRVQSRVSHTSRHPSRAAISSYVRSSCAEARGLRGAAGAESPIQSSGSDVETQLPPAVLDPGSLAGTSNCSSSGAVPCGWRNLKSWATLAAIRKRYACGFFTTQCAQSAGASCRPPGKHPDIALDDPPFWQEKRCKSRHSHGTNARRDG